MLIAVFVLVLAGTLVSFAQRNVKEGIACLIVLIAIGVSIVFVILADVLRQAKEGRR